MGGLQQVDKGKGEKGGRRPTGRVRKKNAIAGTLCAFGWTGLPKRAAAYERKKTFSFRHFLNGGWMCVLLLATARHY